jgi:TctA family transporter
MNYQLRTQLTVNDFDAFWVEVVEVGQLVSAKPGVNQDRAVAVLLTYDYPVRPQKALNFAVRLAACYPQQNFSASIFYRDGFGKMLEAKTCLG